MREAADLSFALVYVPETVRGILAQSIHLARGRRFEIPGPAGGLMGRTPDHWRKLLARAETL